MLFYVRAVDRPGTGDALEALSEEHQVFMDSYADRLVLRGPTESADGAEHTGSVHVVDVDGRADAERFATEEPFWQAGLYRDLAIRRTDVLLDRGREDPASLLALASATWPHGHRTAAAVGEVLGEAPDHRIRFAAALLDDAGTEADGVVFVVSAPTDEARALIASLADGADVTADRWRRGGRDA
ncbi:YciI family protein [Nocardiopsis coralliicola]